LAATGFLSTGDGGYSAAGNYALLDVVAALRWVADNAASFGGNPASVTLLGHGVGAVLVSLLTFSPLTRGLSLSLYLPALTITVISRCGNGSDRPHRGHRGHALSSSCTAESAPTFQRAVD